MGLEIPKGIRSTTDALVKPAVARTPAPKKPVLSKQERANRRQAHKVRLEKISHERLRYNENLAKMTPERARLLDNLASEKKRQQQQVNGLMDEHFASASAGKLLDKVFQSEMIQPILNQLQGNIDKLDHSIEWHRSKLRALSAEERTIEQELADFDADDLTEVVSQQYESWRDCWLLMEQAFEKFKDAINQARSLDRNFLQRLPRIGIDDETLNLVVDSKLKDEFIAVISPASLVDELSRTYSLKANWCYQDPNISVSRRIQSQQHLLQKSNWDDGRKIGKIV